MNGGQLWPDDLRIKIIIKAGNGNLIRNPDSSVCKIIDSFHSCVIRRKCQCLCLQKMWQQLFIFFQSAPGFLGNHHITGTTAEAAISFHCLFKSKPPCIITVLFCLRNKKRPVVSTGIQIFPDLISSGIIIYSYILKAIFAFRIGIDQYHLFIQLSGKLVILFFVISYNDEAFYIPAGCHIYHIIDPFTANEHNIIASVFCFDLQRSGDLSHKRILQRLHTMNEGKTKNHSNDP